MDGYGNVWTEEKVKNEIFKCMEILQIDRMPTSVELKTLERNDLHIKISRTRKYSGWAEFLGLDRKDSETLIGQKYEEVASQKLITLGYTVERMTTKFPYDLLVNGTVKIDVKYGSPYLMRGSRVHSFGINKKNQTCDLYIVLAADGIGGIERSFIIPSHKLKVVTLCIGENSKYNRFIDRWDLIDKYANFHAVLR